jgi:hypothetical protein
MPRKPIKAPAGPVTVTNCVKGLVVHLGDGRRLAYGESAEVTPETAAQLRAGGMCE